MSYLLDTNVLIRAWHEPDRVSAQHRSILDSDVEISVSVASVWEIAIKAGLGKLQTVPEIAKAVIETGYDLLPITTAHAEAVRHLPRLHRDPFDRMLIVQSRMEGLTLLTTDRQISSYDVQTL